MSLENIRVMVVDDSNFSAQLIGSLLHALGVETVVTCRSAEDGLAFLAERSDRVDLAIIDWVMPGMGGLDMLRAIRSPESPTRKLPVILISGEPLKERVEQARKAGVHDFLVKPLSARRLGNAVRNSLDHARPFIISETYVGPDRRWQKGEFEGEDQRRNDVAATEEAPPPQDAALDTPLART